MFPEAQSFGHDVCYELWLSSTIPINLSDLLLQVTWNWENVSLLKKIGNSHIHLKWTKCLVYYVDFRNFFMEVI